MTVRGYLYFVADAAAGAVKIGWSANPRERFKTLQVGSLATLRLVGYFPDDGEGLTEANLHDLFAPHKLRGEWFDLTAADLVPYLEVAAEYAAWHGAGSLRAADTPPPPHILELAKNGWRA